MYFNDKMVVMMRLLVFLFHLFISLSDGQYTVTIESDTPYREVEDRYLSVCLDSVLVKKRWERSWEVKKFDFESVRLKTMSSALGPSFLRLGGTESAFLVYDPNSQKNQPRARENFTMTVADWDNVNKFAMDAGWKFLFDFNVLLRKDGLWDPTNAKEMLDRSIDRGYTANQLFQLGNEPNSMPGQVGFDLPAANLSVDFTVLRGVLDNERYAPYYSQALVVGPDTTDSPNSASPYLAEFLEGPASSVINAVSCHQYYGAGSIATVDDFMDPAVMDLLEEQMERVKAVVYSIMPANTPIWLTETSSFYNGGAPGLSNAYVAGFLWLDKLGAAAQLGISAVFRQTYYGSSYCMLTRDLQPLPDYWLSLVFKRLVDKKVLMVRSETSSGRLRLYAHCTNTARSGYPEGAITMFGMNVYNTDTTITIGGGMETQSVDVYRLTPNGGDLTSKFVDLNGEMLVMPDDVTMPPLNPVTLPTAEDINFPAQTLAFFVIPNAQARACMN